jgi:hypothetical protein
MLHIVRPFFRASHRPEKGTGRWITEEGHGDPSKCALGIFI